MYTIYMSEQALYRKYRPQRFADVIGQDHVVKVLEGAIKEENVTHAYLFSGSRGTGKTSVARMLAKELGTSEKDLYEIDAASYTGVEDIRAIRDAVSTLPFDSKYKVYIIDEVHMLSKSAFNALLKTLEEPPKHVIFVLATTEQEKLPETVVSRCQVFMFKKPTEEILKNFAITVAKKEGYSLEGGAAELVAILGDGSYRDTLGILQKVITATGEKKITEEAVAAVTGAPKGSVVNSLLLALHEGKLDAALMAVSSGAENNIDMKLFVKLLLHKVRAVLLLRFAPELKGRLAEQFSAEDLKLLEKMAKEGTKINSALLSELLDAYVQTGLSYIPQLPLELALVKILKEA